MTTEERLEKVVKELAKAPVKAAVQEQEGS